MSIRTDPAARALRPGWLRRRFAKWPGLLYRFGLGTLISKRVMVLTTRGRVTGIDRRTPLWYVRDGDTIYCFSGWGSSSDWLKNLKTAPDVRVQVGRETWETRGIFIQGSQALERILRKFREKYGDRTVRLFYHLDHLVLVAFSLSGQKEMPGKMHDAN